MALVMLSCQTMVNIELLIAVTHTKCICLYLPFSGFTDWLYKNSKYGNLDVVIGLLEKLLCS